MSDSLEERDLLALVQGDVRLLDVVLHADIEATANLLAVGADGAHLVDLDAEERLDGHLDLELVAALVDLEEIDVVLLVESTALLGVERLANDFLRLHDDTLLVTPSTAPLVRTRLRYLRTRSEEHTSELQSPCNLV